MAALGRRRPHEPDYRRKFGALGKEVAMSKRYREYVPALLRGIVMPGNGRQGAVPLLARHHQSWLNRQSVKSQCADA